jgi:hypothetical protein
MVCFCQTQENLWELGHQVAEYDSPSVFTQKIVIIHVCIILTECMQFFLLLYWSVRYKP